MRQLRMTEKNIARCIQRIEPLVYCQRQSIPPFRIHVGDEPLVSPNINEAEWPVVEPGVYWGEPNQSFTLHTSFTVPTNWMAPICLCLPLGRSGQFVHPEALAYIDGHVYQGVNPYHHEICLPTRWCDGEQHSLALFGWIGTGDEPLRMGQPMLAQIHQPTRDFIAAARVALGVLSELDMHDPTRACLHDILDRAFQILDLREPFGDSFYSSLQSARSALDDGIAEAGNPMSVDFIAVGHAHIDIAWLWPISQTRQKAARTFSSVLRLMEQFPEFHFTQSQPQLYRFIDEDHPDVANQIKVRVEEGRWLPVGGMWVEPDCNLIGAESLVRQLLLGRSYFRDRYGHVESPILWLPDTFGFPWTLPQLAEQAGLNYFMTTKLSWNQTNRLPHDSFWWQGLDGTRLLTHFITTPDVEGNDYHTYNGDLKPTRVIGAWRNYQQKGSNTELLTTFGWGDGGGGPTREMIEDGQRLASHPGAPRVRFGNASEFFTNLQVRAGDRLPIWNGELYLEYHRGTYTSQAHIKRKNRKCEYLLHDAEFLAAWASVETEMDYPHSDLTQVWRLLCRNQFHDVIAGVCIKQVYLDNQDDYEQIRTVGEQVRNASLQSLSQLLPENAAIVAVNPTSFGGRHLGLLPERLDHATALVDLSTGGQIITQIVDEGTLVEIPHIDPYGYVALGFADGSNSLQKDAVVATLIDDVSTLENAALRVEFNREGDIHRIYDKDVGREVIPPGQHANCFKAFMDRPFRGDAWNIDSSYEDKSWIAEPASSFSVRENGPLRASLEVRRPLLRSEILQRIHLYKDYRRLDFDTWVDWRERNVLLKVAFPVNVLSPEATYDIQWGNIRRPTHRNTSWDQARFEVCAHKWVDLSEGDYGVSLLNDCKYGHDVLGNVIRLTLLRGTTFPDPDADRGEHRFIYSLFPHPGDWRRGTLPASYALNDPLILQRVQGGVGGIAARSFVNVDKPNVIIETVKQAEDSHGLIVRVFENERCRGPIRLQVGFPIAEVYLCNLLEENKERLPCSHDGVQLHLNPYQIVTLRLVPAARAD